MPPPKGKMEQWNTGTMDKKRNIGIMKFWNIGLRTEKKFSPNSPSFPFSSVPKYFFTYSVIPIAHMGLHPIQKRAKILFALFLRFPSSRYFFPTSSKSASTTSS
jgi:hypothetical protein